MLLLCSGLCNLWFIAFLCMNFLPPLLQEASKEMFAIFKDFFEDPHIKKVWHNYSFDRHVLRNHGIDCQGFTGDTMHMARLWDSSRQGKGYSLESLTG